MESILTFRNYSDQLHYAEVTDDIEYVLGNYENEKVTYRSDFPIINQIYTYFYAGPEEILVRGENDTVFGIDYSKAIRLKTKFFFNKSKNGIDYRLVEFTGRPNYINYILLKRSLVENRDITIVTEEGEYLINPIDVILYQDEDYIVLDYSNANEVNGELHGFAGNIEIRLQNTNQDLTANCATYTIDGSAVAPTVFYEDRYNNKLTEYFNFNINERNQFFVIPEEVDHLGVYNKYGTKERFYTYNTANLEQLHGSPLYSVGLMSDVHYNDWDESDESPLTFEDDGAEYSADLQNALSIFNEKDVDFVACSGDISTDDINHLRNYRSFVDMFAPGLPVYTCSGNHDTVLKKHHKEEWMANDHLNPKYDITRADDNECTSFYFVKELSNGKKDVFIFLNLEYGFSEDEWYDTHNPRLLYEEELLTKDSVDDEDVHIYDPSTLRWLANLLEEHKDDRCFIFTHIMFAGLAGSYTGDEDYYRYYEDHRDVMRGDQGAFLRNLLMTYKNNYWFSGHSHYKWLWENIDHNMNVCPANDSYTLHIPSLARPLVYGTRWYDVAMRDSESAIMDVYEDCVVIKGMVNKNESLREQFDYEDNVANVTDEELTYVTAEMFNKREGNNTYIEQLEDNYIMIHTSYSDESTEINDIFVNDGTINANNYGNMIPVIRIEDVYIFDNDFNNVTGQVLAERCIGFRDSVSEWPTYLYLFDNNHRYDTYENGVLFKVSSMSEYRYQNLNIKLKMKIGFIYSTTYENKYLPIAIYKLPSRE